MQIQSSFIDHTLLDKSTLGKLYQKFDYVPLVQASSNNIVFVNTCHRVEFYHTCNDPILFRINEVQSNLTQTTQETARRLINIMSGINSVILGETFISQQVVKHLNKNNKLNNFFNQCLDISNLARKEFNFYNKVDYNTIAISLLPKSDNLTLIGGGMLVNDILNKVKNYKNITVITRNPKKFKKTTKILDNVTVLKLDNYELQDSTNCIIATTLNDDYRLKIQKKISSSTFSKIIDLSSEPIFDLHTNSDIYIHMNDSNFFKEIKSGNSKLYNRVLDIKKFIDIKIKNF